MASWRIVLLSTTLAASLAVLLMIWQRPFPADIHPNEVISLDGGTRSYRIVIPHQLPIPAPVVFAFHGIGDSTESMANYSRLDDLAAHNGFVLVYPAAHNSMWATINVDPDNLDANLDVRFFDELIDYLSNRRAIDLDRVYLVGNSDGATFAQLLATARPHQIAGLAAHSGPRLRELHPSENQRPIMLLVGANDSAASAIKSDADQYRKEGQVVEMVVVPGLGHEWSKRHNEQMWRFLSRHSLKDGP
jgi:polyhydroxybutyrate depolymerase